MNEIADRLAEAGAGKPLGEIERTYITEYDEDIPIIRTHQKDKNKHGADQKDDGQKDDDAYAPHPLKDILPTAILQGLVQTRKKHLDQATLTYRRMTTPNSARRHFGKALQTLPTRAARRAIQIVTGSFPSQTRLKLWKKADSGQCPFCKTADETIEHFSQCCPQFREARTAAHDTIWGATWTALKECLPSSWEAIHDTRMRDVPLLTEQEYDNMKPDGLLLNKRSGEIIILEAARCSGFSGADTHERQKKKVEKYNRLAQNITTWNKKEYRKGARVCALICTFTGALDENHWETELTRILTATAALTKPHQVLISNLVSVSDQVPVTANIAAHVDRIISIAVRTTLEAFDDMAEIRAAAKRTLNHKQDTP
jgi:hypothetical protein